MVCQLNAAPAHKEATFRDGDQINLPGLGSPCYSPSSPRYSTENFEGKDQDEISFDVSYELDEYPLTQVSAAPAPSVKRRRDSSESSQSVVKRRKVEIQSPDAESPSSSLSSTVEFDPKDFVVDDLSGHSSEEYVPSADESSYVDEWVSSDESE